MNKLSINGEPVLAHYLPFKKKGTGSILRLLIKDPKIHTLIAESIRQRLKQGGIMEDTEKKVRDKKLPGKKFSEIRLLGNSVLWVADHLRSEGFSVTEEDPYYA